MWSVPALLLSSLLAPIPPLIDSAPVVAEAQSAPIVDTSALPELIRLQAEPLEVRDDGGMIREGSVVALREPLVTTRGRVVLEGAAAMRLRIGAAPGTVVWLAGSEDEEFLRFEPTETATWGPTTRGASVNIVAEGEVTITEMAQLGAASNAQTSCLEDVACSTDPELAQASRAIAYIRFVRGGQSFVCSGGLVSDRAGTRTPYLLTARHCIGSAQEAASVEVIWDLRSSACGSNRMAAISRSHGAELLVSSATTDVTLLKLASLPPDRVFLGVDPRPLPPGARVRHVSHAYGLSQTYSEGLVDAGAPACSVAPRPRFLYSSPETGAIATGSSGAPLLLPGLYVAGQLLGTCGPVPGDACARFNAMVDGSLREAWPLLAPFLDPGAGGGKRRAVR